MSISVLIVGSPTSAGYQLLLVCDEEMVIGGPSYTQFPFQLVQNRQRGLILRLCCRHPFDDSLVGMVPRFIISQRVDRLFEFLVGFFRYLLLRLGLSSGLQCVANNLKDTFITVEQGLGWI
jgi:hypothetical protein